MIHDVFRNMVRNPPNYTLHNYLSLLVQPFSRHAHIQPQLNCLPHTDLEDLSYNMVQNPAMHNWAYPCFHKSSANMHVSGTHQVDQLLVSSHQHGGTEL